jgi:ACT domain-containing protein
MNEEQLIYEITKAIYARLGSTASRETVEELVADVYRAVRPAVANAHSAPAPSASHAGGDDTGSQGRVIVSVFGLDRPGIVSAVSSVLADADCSIADINQTVVAGKFAMVLVADSSRSTVGVAELKERFREMGARLGVNIYAQREDLFNAMHRV